MATVSNNTDIDNLFNENVEIRKTTNGDNVTFSGIGLVDQVITRKPKINGNIQNNIANNGSIKGTQQINDFEVTKNVTKQPSNKNFFFIGNNIVNDGKTIDVKSSDKRTVETFNKRINNINLGQKFTIRNQF